MGQNFFLYSIYDEGQICHGRFKNFVKKSQTAYVKGALGKLNCGLILLLGGGQNLIPGKLVELELSENHWPLFDGLNGVNSLQPEKSFIHKENCEVFVPESTAVLAQTYVFNPQKINHSVIELSPEECLLINQQPEASLVEKLTERQRTYIQKLSQAKGREIIPVDMALYRELMSLGLIVDKGRRLALTNLGVEVSLFL